MQSSELASPFRPPSGSSLFTPFELTSFPRFQYKAIRYCSVGSFPSVSSCLSSSPSPTARVFLPQYPFPFVAQG